MESTLKFERGDFDVLENAERRNTLVRNAWRNTGSSAISKFKI